MSTDNILEPDADAFEESADTSDIKVEAVGGDYIEPATGQDPEATS
jgi:hypothetical protein